MPLERRFKCSITLGYCYELQAHEPGDAVHAVIARRSPSGEPLERDFKCSITLGYCYEFAAAAYNGPANATDISNAKRSETTGEPLVRRLKCPITLDYCYGLAEDAPSLPADQPGAPSAIVARRSRGEAAAADGLERRLFKCTISLGYCYELAAPADANSSTTTDVAKRSPAGEPLDRRFSCSITLEYCYEWASGIADGNSSTTTSATVAKQSDTAVEPLERRWKCSITLGYCYGKKIEAAAEAETVKRSESSTAPEARALGLAVHRAIKL